MIWSRRSGNDLITLFEGLYVVETASVTGIHWWGTALGPHAEETSPWALVLFPSPLHSLSLAIDQFMIVGSNRIGEGLHAGLGGI